MAEKDDLHPPGTLVAVSNRGPASQWQVGTYKGIDPAGLHRVSFSAGSTDLFFDADRIRGPGEIYIGRRGDAMDPMTFGEALGAVHGLASEHQPKNNDDPDNSELSKVLDWQRTALETVQGLLVNYHEQIDEVFRPPVVSGAWSEAEVGCRRDLDPDNPVDALRICLELGETGIPEQRDSRDPVEADAINRAQQACNLVRDLIGVHRGDLEARIALVPFR